MSKNFRCPKGWGIIPCLCSISVAAGSLSCGIRSGASPLLCAWNYLYDFSRHRILSFINLFCRWPFA